MTNNLVRLNLSAEEAATLEGVAKDSVLLVFRADGEHTDLPGYCQALQQLTKLPVVYLYGKQDLLGLSDADLAAIGLARLVKL